MRARIDISVKKVRDIMRSAIIVLILVVILVPIISVSDSLQPDHVDQVHPKMTPGDAGCPIMNNTDLPGSDYIDLDLSKADPKECQKLCDGDTTCLAWSYVKPGIQGPSARCWLKDTIPDQVVDSCCVSGQKLCVVGVVTTACEPNLPTPIVTYTGSELYTGSDGSKYTRYNLLVKNYYEYSSDLFLPAPDLPPCGKNTDSSRTWINIYDASGNRLYGFCALTSPAELQNLWFSVPIGALAPVSATVEIEDRACGIVSSSTSIPISYTIIIPDEEVEPLKNNRGESDGITTSPDQVVNLAGTEIFIKKDTDIPGQDYSRFELDTANPISCAQVCAEDPRCQSFTYVKPGIQGNKANCWLKSGNPAEKSDSCCISGTKPVRSAGPVRSGGFSSENFVAETQT